MPHGFARQAFKDRRTASARYSGAETAGHQQGERAAVGGHARILAQHFEGLQEAYAGQANEHGG